MRRAAAAEDGVGRARSVYLAPWRIDLVVRPGVRSPVPAIRLARAIAAALEMAGAPRPAAVGLVLSGDAELAGLNELHMGSSGPTDVLSFPLLGPETYPPHVGKESSRDAGPGMGVFVGPPGARPLLGEIVVSVDRAIEQARAGTGGQTGTDASTAADELLLLVVHGTLHLCGWDHADALEGAAMRALERDILGGPWRHRSRRNVASVRLSS